MILGILSDTHGRVVVAQEAIRILRARDAEYFIHCGDVGDGVLAVLPAERSAFVFGNTDFDRHGLREEAERHAIRCCETFGDLALGGKRVAVTHGDEPRIVREIRTAGQFDYLLTGHTHVAHDFREGRLRCINPGALQRTSRKSVATLDLATDLLTLHEIDAV